jgi:hypothetical protein
MANNEQSDEIVELQPEETKAVVGGAAPTQAQMAQYEGMARVAMPQKIGPYGPGPMEPAAVHGPVHAPVHKVG